MKVLNLRCAHGHLFEGWFASDDEFVGQNGRGLVECPLCGDKVVTRMPTAPRLNLSAPTAAASQPVAQAQAVDPEARQQAAWLTAVRSMMANTEDVGNKFSEEARRIHYGETAHRGIRGQATADEREALRDEGIETFSLPVPPGLKGPVQ
jgi:hypothetical protein